MQWYNCNMKTFIETTDKTFAFSSCDACPARCCDGREGSIFSQLLLSDFRQVAKNFPILFTFGEMGYLKANVLLSDGNNFCPYIVENKCTIYDERPAVCRNYPLSANINNKIYIDDSCPAVFSNLDEQVGIKIVDDDRITKEFNSESLINYQDKFLDTHLHLAQFNDKINFEKVVTIKNMEFYQFVGTTEDKYMQIHIDSMKNINKVIKG